MFLVLCFWFCLLLRKILIFPDRTHFSKEFRATTTKQLDKIRLDGWMNAYRAEQLEEYQLAIDLAKISIRAGKNKIFLEPSKKERNKIATGIHNQYDYIERMKQHENSNLR